MTIPITTLTYCLINDNVILHNTHNEKKIIIIIINNNNDEEIRLLR